MSTSHINSTSSNAAAKAQKDVVNDTDPQIGIDYTAIDELDPSLVDGYRVFYERDVPFELRSAVGYDSPTEVGALEAIRVKILLLGDPASPEALRVELSSESNLFFHYMHNMNPASFREMQQTQHLMVDFPDYAAVLLRMLNQCISSPHSHLAVLVMQPNGEARLDFIQNMEYKFVELLSMRLVASSEETVRLQVAYRYNTAKARLALMQTRLADIVSLLKLKSPSLLLQLQRTPLRVPGVAVVPAGPSGSPRSAASAADRRSPNHRSMSP